MMLLTLSVPSLPVMVPTSPEPGVVLRFFPGSVLLQSTLQSTRVDMQINILVLVEGTAWAQASKSENLDSVMRGLLTRYGDTRWGL